jgi:hypothetical protein
MLYLLYARTRPERLPSSAYAGRAPINNEPALVRDGERVFRPVIAAVGLASEA